jgi:hypothetical protein
MNEVVHIDKETASAALRDAAFTSEVDGRTTVHSFLGGIGADHDLDLALGLVIDAEEIAWTTHLLRHDLAVRVDGRVYHYDVPRPERIANASERKD